jgi:hypothetical protein
MVDEYLLDVDVQYKQLVDIRIQGGGLKNVEIRGPLVV